MRHLHTRPRRPQNPTVLAIRAPLAREVSQKKLLGYACLAPHLSAPQSPRTTV